MPTSSPLILARVISCVFSVVALGVLGYGEAAIIEDLRYQGEFLDGYAAYVGGLMVVGALLSMGLTAAVVFCRRRVVAACCGLALSATTLCLALWLLDDRPQLQILALGLALALGASSALVLAERRGTRPARSGSTPSMS